jgi:L-lactate dehydrogenase complex protein LldE
VRAALFITCFNDTLFPQTGSAAVAVLERVGVEVDFPLEQTCCGQMHANTGYGHEAIGLVRRFVRVFGDAEAVVTPSGSCAAMVREGYERLAADAGDEALATDVRALAPRVFELSEFLTGRLGLSDVGAAFPHRVTYHPTCHSLRLLHVGDAPLRLLRGVAGIDLVELPDADQCCGFGGTFAVKYPAISGAIVEDKINCIRDTKAETTICNDAGCTMNISGMLHRRGQTTKVRHLAELMAEAMGLDLTRW